MNKPGYTYNALVNRVVDGDTVILMVDMGFEVWSTQKFRLAYINTPEKSAGAPWQAATDRLRALLPAGGDCFVKSLGKDKYGRWLGEVHVGDVSVNQTLLDEGLAVPYGR